ncbi:hypothetical protein PPL_07453 [Heterostelium album PN500]|uniref:Uncharacterized protein n=1 Tax=Heterostelium pallidum (strain ATCC 26659 / Pp 5 / PN500) TaxID=670386 RepID=D3BG02_HETP5|nr:hypothetical protein PPL_07453 [Heterostelium album PN500]EFA79594.1 hypothetical protein PPL_07453 [Heterostelium album PN500]|eukprot:XP_020431715.1 hypothetical protein PPL_07453 [Heterostelium album PN500]
MEHATHTCYNTISVAFDSDILLEKTKFSIPITSTDSKNLSPISSIQTLLSTQSFYFSIQTISNTQNLPINISLQYQDTQTFDFTNITTLVCNRFPLFQPYRSLTCTTRFSSCILMPTSTANTFVTSEVNLIRNIRYFPPNNTNYIETFSFQAGNIQQIMMFDSPLLKSNIMSSMQYLSSSGNNFGLMYQNNQNGASYISGIGSASEETHYFICGAKTEEYLQLGMSFTTLFMGVFSFTISNITNSADISVVRIELISDYIRDYQISATLIPTTVMEAKYPSEYENTLFKYRIELPYTNQYSDALVFEILDFQMTRVNSFIIITRISISTNYEIIKVTMNSETLEFQLLEGTPFNGTYELSIYNKINIDTFTFSFVNTRGEVYNLYSSQFYNNLESTDPYLSIDTAGKKNNVQ